MKNNKSSSISRLSLSIFIVSAIVAFLYKFNNTIQVFIQEQIPVVANYGINTVCLGIVILGLIIALIFRNQPERCANSDDDDDGDDRLPYPSPHNPPEPPYHPTDPQTEKTISAEPIVQQIIIQPIIEQPIQRNDETPTPRSNHNDNINHNQSQPSYYNSNYKKKPVIQNNWKPKPRKKKKLIFRNYWDKRSWNSR